jgi:hypothetical protein
MEVHDLFTRLQLFAVALCLSVWTWKVWELESHYWLLFSGIFSDLLCVGMFIGRPLASLIDALFVI